MNLRSVSGTNKNSWIKSSLLLLGIGVVAKAIALIKEGFIASNFGIGPELDYFYQIILVPIFIANLLGSPLAQVIIPSMLQNEGTDAKKISQAFFAFVLKLLLALLPITMFITRGFQK